VLLALAGALAVGLSACAGGGNANISAAEDALEAGNYQQALASVNQALAADSANAQAYMLRARIYKQQAQDTTLAPERRADLVERSVQAQEQALQFDPGVEPQTTLMRLETYSQQFNRAVELFNRANESQSSEAFIDAAAVFDAAAAAEPDSATAYLYQGYSLLNAGNRDEAVDPLQSYIQTADSANADAYAFLGQIYLTQDENERAVEVLEEGAQRHPGSSEVQSLLLNAYNAAGMTERAMAAYEEQVQENPSDPTYRYNYGSMLLNAGRYDAAIEQLRRATELDPDNPNAYFNLGAAFVNQAVDANDRLRALGDSMRENSDQMSQAQRQELEARRSDLAEERADLFREAIDPLERARELAEEDAPIYSQICVALLQAYAQTEQMEKVAEVEECAGYNEESGR
jgi:tetratricopeptide (TPR) repeat protein